MFSFSKLPHSKGNFSNILDYFHRNGILLIAAFCIFASLEYPYPSIVTTV